MVCTVLLVVNISNGLDYSAKTLLSLSGIIADGVTVTDCEHIYHPKNHHHQVIHHSMGSYIIWHIHTNRLCMGVFGVRQVQFLS